MVTDSGLTGFDGTVLENYTKGNGLLSYSINGITTTRNDTLWIVSDLGASKLDGNTFIDYSGQGGKDIETDSLDRVYVLRYSFAVDRFPFTRVYENGVWSMPVSTGLSTVYNNAKFIKTETNNLFLTSTSGNFAYFFKINYPANCIKQSLYVDNSPYDRFSTNSLIDLSHFEESDNYRWFGAGFNSSFYHVSSDSNSYSQYINNTIAKSSCIHLKNSILAIGSDSGIYFTTPTLKSTTKRLEFAVNTIRTSVEITDSLFSNLAQYPNDMPGFEFPKDSNSYGIYSANFIVAAKKSSQSNFKVYPLRGFAQAFSPGPITSSGGLANGYLVRVLKQEIINHKLNFNSPGYSTPRGIKYWPAYGDPIAGISIDLAPFFDFNNDGGYNPQDGDYPIIKGDEALYWINHPSDLNLELEYHWMMYGFNSLTLDQTIFLQYTIINRATTVFDSLKIGLFIDADIGNARDDYMGSDSLNNLLYFYNGDQFDEDRLGLNGYGNTSPALGIKFLSDTMENSIYFTSSNLANGIPYSVQHWMNFMNSKWKNGQPIISMEGTAISHLGLPI